ncbi:uncharacterized protein METZ01_LOCUS225728 [marine metagenome]|uniref:Uncharacterized protein n=1 Tax=marine metagenome TaxID=408172 RepID=A0A382GDV2_9ZZZZ
MGALRRLISRMFLYGGIGLGTFVAVALVETIATRYLLDEALNLSLWQKLVALAVVLVLMATFRRRVRAPRRERGIRAALRALR